MQNIGRIFNHDWMLPIKSLAVKIVLKSSTQKKQWLIMYSRNTSRWSINGSALNIEGASEFSFEGMHYFLALSSPSEEYLYEIEEISGLIMKSSKKQSTFRAIYKDIKKMHGKEAKTYLHYKSILKVSKCFIKISMEDTLENKKVVWRVNTKQLENFRKAKSSVQTICVDLTNEKESINMFYTKDLGLNLYKSTAEPAKEEAQNYL